MKNQQCLEDSINFLLGSVFAPCVPNVQVWLPTTEQSTGSLRISSSVSMCVRVCVCVRTCVVSLGARLTYFVV